MLETPTIVAGGPAACPHLNPGPHESRPGAVSVILVNYKGAEDTIACLRHFDEVDWPEERLELIVIENDSQDGSARAIAEAHPGARVIPSGANLGFAGGCNLGVDLATGEYVAFLNNDARPDAGWVRAAVAAMEADPAIGAVASKVLDWEGSRIDYVDGSLTWFGMGYKREADKVDDGAFDAPRDVLFGTGAALFVRADLFRRVGGFDERFFMFYEDVDLGWRLNLLGHRVRYVPGSLAFHRHHVTMKKFGNFREQYLLERNALLSMYKNYDDESLARALPAALDLAVTRTSGLAQQPLALPQGAEAGSRTPVAKMALTGAYAVDYLVEQLETVAATRADLQARRRRSDEELFALFRHPIESAFLGARYVEAHTAAVGVFGLDERFVAAPRALVVTGEPLAARLAGPAIRAWEMARALGARQPTRLLSTAGVADDVVPDGFEVVSAAGPGLREHTDWADVIVFQGFLLEGAPWLVDSDKIVVADIYDPMHLEQLEQAKDLGPRRRRETIHAVTDVLNRQLARADRFLCASDKQRDFWLGQLAVNGRVNPLTLPEGRPVDELVSVVPFGIQDEDPRQRRHGIRGRVPGIGMDDKVIVWGGGVYNWFDPLTLVRAVGGLSRRHPDVRLYFMGLKHPNPGVPDMRIAWETQQLSEELGLTGAHVFFNTGWVPYAERADVLLDADIGVSTHFEHVETAFSFRTRILDYLWAGLPVVATVGDSFGDCLDAEGLGRGVPPEDVDALERALEEMLYDEAAAAAARERVRVFAERFRWRSVLAPLLEFCARPARAQDLALTGGAAGSSGLRSRAYPRPRPSAGRDLALVVEYMRAGGPREVLRRARGRVRRVLAR